MDITFNTQIVDVTVAIKALKHYRAGEYQEAIKALLDILDFEPKNWDARLMLGVSYYRSGQYAGAQRSFRWIYDNCGDGDLKFKALEALQSCNAKLQKASAVPAEFGNCVERMPTKVSWLDL